MEAPAWRKGRGEAATIGHFFKKTQDVTSAIYQCMNPCEKFMFQSECLFKVWSLGHN